MGYIMPVTNYQYNDYQKRVIEDKKDPIHIERPFKVVLETQHEEIVDEHRRKEKIELTEARKPFKYTANHMMYGKAAARITGKGQLFSEGV